MAPEQLGTTLMHEHVFVVNPEVAANFPARVDEEAAVARAVERMAELRAGEEESTRSST